jgi:hypothetical protein
MPLTPAIETALVFTRDLFQSLLMRRRTCRLKFSLINIGLHAGVAADITQAV